MQTFEQQRDIAYSRGLLEEWVRTGVPPQIREHLKTLTDGYDQLEQEVKKQTEDAARQADVLRKQ